MKGTRGDGGGTRGMEGSELYVVPSKYKSRYLQLIMVLLVALLLVPNAGGMVGSLGPKA